MPSNIKWRKIPLVPTLRFQVIQCQTLCFPVIQQQCLPISVQNIISIMAARLDYLEALCHCGSIQITFNQISLSNIGLSVLGQNKPDMDVRNRIKFPSCRKHRLKFTSVLWAIEFANNFHIFVFSVDVTTEHYNLQRSVFPFQPLLLCQYVF